MYVPMPVLILVGIYALIHSVENLLLKHNKGEEIFTFMSPTLGAIGLSFVGILLAVRNCLNELLKVGSINLQHLPYWQAQGIGIAIWMGLSIAIGRYDWNFGRNTKIGKIMQIVKWCLRLLIYVLLVWTSYVIQPPHAGGLGIFSW